MGNKHVRMAALALMLAGCAPEFTNHGYVPTQEELDGLVIGVDSVATVEELVGRPSTLGMERDRAWYYVASRRRYYTYNPPEEIERRVVVIAFDENSVVSEIRHMGLEDGRIIDLNTRITERRRDRLAVLRQLLGSFGRLNPGQLLGDNQ